MSYPPPPDPNWAWFFDIDGTLAQFASRPDAVVIDDGTLRNIVALGELADGAVAVISGRSVADIDALFGGAVVAAAGQHGNERRRADGAAVRHTSRSPALIAAAAELHGLAAEHPGVVVEDKGLSIAVHYRLAPQLEELLSRRMSALQRSLGRDFLIQGGKLVFEIVPVGRNKGSAVAEFMLEKPFAGRTPTFLGDDVTDEHAFMTVNQFGGNSIKVGPGDSIAQYRLEGVSAVQSWLSQVSAPAGARAARRR